MFVFFLAIVYINSYILGSGSISSTTVSTPQSTTGSGGSQGSGGSGEEEPPGGDGINQTSSPVHVNGTQVKIKLGYILQKWFVFFPVTTFNLSKFGKDKRFTILNIISFLKRER